MSPTEPHHSSQFHLHIWTLTSFSFASALLSHFCICWLAYAFLYLAQLQRVSIATVSVQDHRHSMVFNFWRPRHWGGGGGYGTCKPLSKQEECRNCSALSVLIWDMRKNLYWREICKGFLKHTYFIKVHYICEGLSGQVRKHTVRLARRVLSFFSSRRNWIWYPRDHFKSLNWPIELFSKNFAWIIGKNLYSHEHPAFKKGPNWALLKI